MNSRAENWEKVESWRRRAENFLVEVKHFAAKSYGETFSMGEGPHRWAVYVYIYPQHPFFKECEVTGGMRQRVANYLPFHLYCSFADVHVRVKEDGAHEVTSFQFGADYHHLHDEFYTHMKDELEAGTVFAEAQELYDYMIQGELR